MVSFCANPECIEEYRYAGHGRIIVVERASIAEDGNTIRERELFWLCRACAPVFNLVTINGDVRCIKANRSVSQHREVAHAS